MTEGDPLTRRVMSAVGAHETHSNPKRPGFEEPYETLAIADVLSYERTHVPKEKARWILCSTYHQPDGRSHKAQEAHGSFTLAALDIDTGNVQGRSLVKAINSFTGGAKALIYSSSSATQASRKWRVLIPLLALEKFDTWHALQIALGNHVERELGIPVDRSLERAGQPIYLPNSAPRHDGAAPYEMSKLIEGEPFDWRLSDAANFVIDVMTKQEEAAQEQEKRRMEARQRMAKARLGGDGDRSVIEQFNAANDLASVLTATGFTPGPRDSWRSPLQTSKSFATKLFDEPAGQYWTSMSTSDFEAGIGRHTADGRACFGDAFDLWCFFNYQGDRTTAIKAAVELLGIERPHTPTMMDDLAQRVRKNQTAAIGPQNAPLAPLDVGQSLEKHRAAILEATIKGESCFVMPAVSDLSDATVYLPGPVDPETIHDTAPAPAPAADLTDADMGKEPVLPLPYIVGNNLPGWEPQRELVEGLLLEGAMSIVYGASNTGKSFMVMDMGIHISLGLQWFGRQVQKKAVLYLAAESPRSIIDRARIKAQRLGQELDNFFIVPCSVNLYDVKGDTAAVVQTVQDIEQKHGVKVGLIIVDTVARVMGGGDENSTKDMGTLIKHLDLIRGATLAHVCSIHHSGKDATKGARGSSALLGATDTEIEVTDRGSDKPKEFKITKQRDLGGKGELFGFALEVVPLGAGVFGSMMTTCIVHQAEVAQAEDDGEWRHLVQGQREIMLAIDGSPTRGLKHGDIIKACTTPERTTSRNIKKLVEQRLIYLIANHYRIGTGDRIDGEF
jgi:hypothetical protein